MSRLLDNVVGELSKLPGVGRRTALRLALHILRQDINDADLLAGSIYEFRRDIKHCSLCNNLCDNDICPICVDDKRDKGIICVVEHVADLISIENTQQFGGLYHVLGGVISPIAGISPTDLKIDLLLQNINRYKAREIILALPTTIEGETTSYYISRRLTDIQITISAISRGIGFGDEIEYADPLTVSHAIRNRKIL